MRLTPHDLNLLVYLAERPNKLVSSKELLEALWPDTVTGDYSVKNAISRLRRKLHDDAKDPTYIDTVSKRGYRLIAPVTQQSVAQPVALASTELSVAVLPFENMSSDPEQEYFSDGLAEDILNGLVNSSQLKVVARTSSFKFKGKNEDVRRIGQELGVTHVVEGSVRKVRRRIRVTAQLNSTTDGSHLWSEQYDRELTDVFEVQDEITRAVLGALNVQFSPIAAGPGTRSIEAHNAVRTAGNCLARMDVDSALDALNEAIELDPNYAQAYAMIAEAHFLAMTMLPDRPGSTRAAFEESLRRALNIDPDNRLAVTYRSVARFRFDREYQAGINDLHALLNRYPTHISVVVQYSEFMRLLGKWKLAVDLERRWIDLDPLNASAHRQLGQTLLHMGRYEEAQTSARQAERLGAPVPYLLFLISFMKGDEQRIHTLLAMDPWGGQARPARDWAISEFAISRGDKQTAAETVARLRRLPRGSKARFFIRMYEGDFDGALDVFERVTRNSGLPLWTETREPTPVWRELFPEFYSHPRYLEILKSIGLDDESVAKLVIPPLPF